MTDRNIRVEPVVGRAVEDQEVEIVERKGLGHPDSICDGIAEAVSKALARTYLERFGEVLHYNTDETQLVAGSAAPTFGGGEVLEPIYLLITGRATKKYDGQRIPAETIALRAAREYLAENFPELDFGTDVVVDIKLGEGSGDLQDVFDDEGRRIPMANDTSFGVGHAPLTETEQVVLETERQLNGHYADEHPVVGPDIKVMGKREGDHIDVTVAVAIIDSYVEGYDDYDDAVAGIREFVSDLAADITDREVRVHVNTADDYDEGSIYLTTTGTSAEQGDDGSVGRGNRANGLITPNRSMSMEATSGKNPVNHIGKIYNLLSTQIAESVVAEVDGIREIRIRLLSQIGEPIDDPHVADASLVTEDGVSVGDIEDEVSRIIDRELADVTSITERVIAGELTTF
ncbi:methionine adenosyltransferase [Haloglomus salinum]|uniref:methionine adenosyltransferase n=1 Tax=Haloglomus salinum TaxID=2962673 RepID=UPI0020C9713D|nr:methionine adenosyltransferase [Haloglomus salinum]